MFKDFKIQSELELPYKLIDIAEDGEHFIFAFKCFDEDQSEYSVQAGGVNGRFEVIYRCCGIDSQFECDITVGNVYNFYIELDNAYDIQLGKNTVANLKNYGDNLNRASLTFNFDKTGHCVLFGAFKNKDNLYKSGIDFEIKIDQTYIPEILVSLERFFEELIKIQGHSRFY